MKKKLLALMLTVLMLLSVVPFTAVSAATMGDVDADGSLSATDARLALRASVGLEVLEGDALWAADVDGDGQPSAADARMILRASVGLENLHTHSFVEEITTPATCEEKGIKTLTCDCGDTKTEEIPALGHTAVTDKATEPTCTKAGKTEGSHCSVCDKVLVAQKTVAKKAHTLVTDKAVKATCQKTGLTAGEHCSVCGTVTKEQKTVAKKAHTLVADKAVAATCEKTGLTAGEHCSVCGTVTKAQTTVGVTKHSGVKVNAAANTCTSSGVKEHYKCKDCGKLFTDSACTKETTLEKLTVGAAHSASKVNAKGATCTADGVKAHYKCSVCKKLFTDSSCKTETTLQKLTVKASHSASKVNAKSATCTTDGVNAHYKCSVCKKLFTDSSCKTETTLQKLTVKAGHKNIALDNTTVKAATCTEDGYSGDYKCGVCGDETTKGAVVPKKGHDTEAVNALSATCTEYGIKAHYKCKTCGQLFRSADARKDPIKNANSLRVIPMGHSLNKVEAIEMTCERNGVSEHYKCAFCGGLFSDSEGKNAIEAAEIISEGHKYGDTETVAPTCAPGYDVRKCTICAYEDKTNVTQGSGEHNYERKEFPATCEENAYSIERCTVCETYLEGTLVESENTATDHIFGAAEPVPPTCTDKGYKTKTCTVEGCGYEERFDFVDEDGHSFVARMRYNSECITTGYVKSQCSGCNEWKVELLGFSDCEPGTPEKITGQKSGLARDAGSEGYSCKSVIRCKDCDKILATGESSSSHDMTPGADWVTEPSCTEAGVREFACKYCSYTEKRRTVEATGHSCSTVVLPTCTQPGSITSEGYCGICNQNIPAGEPVPIPAKGHTLDGMQTCTTAVECSESECDHIEAPALGHSYTKISAATNKSIDTFYCTRCGKAEESKADKLDTFNGVVNKLKTEFYTSYSSADSIATFSKEKNDTTISRFNFGWATSLVKDMYEEQMTNIPDVYTRIYTSYTVRERLPLANTLYTDETDVSALTASDVDSVTVERLSGVDFNSVLSSFNTKYTVGSKEYDLTPYKNIKVNGNVIKVTVDVRNESYYGGIDKLTEAEKTTLQKTYGLDVRAELAEFEKNGNGKLSMTVDENADGAQMTMTTTLNELSTDARVTYYFLEETYEPVIAVYDIYQTMDQDISMEFSMGISIKGTMDPYVKTTDTIVYVFPEYIPQ